jgi:NAD(P)-dependent dehydrogenase (short-subunit alcohol dehydrogenase family)
MAGQVAGKVALITGAARGQGRPHASRSCSGTYVRFKEDAS